MSDSNRIKNIAVNGGTGAVGSKVLKYLQERDTFNITVITREELTAKFSTGVIVKKGDYNSEDFLVSALTGIDAFVITLAGYADKNVQTKLIRAAATAGVPWVIPNEYSGDTSNDAFTARIPVMAAKKEYRDLIVQLGVSSWIAVITNLWIGLNLIWTFMGIDITNRKATIYDHGTHPINWSTIPQIGRSIAALLSLPVNSSNGPSLSDYKNGCFYVRSVYASPAEIIASAQRAIGTKPEDWEITDKNLAEWRDHGVELLARSDFKGNEAALFGSHFTPGLADVYHGKELGSAKLGVPDESLDDIVDNIVEFIC